MNNIFVWTTFLSKHRVQISHAFNFARYLWDVVLELLFLSRNRSGCALALKYYFTWYTIDFLCLRIRVYFRTFYRLDSCWCNASSICSRLRTCATLALLNYLRSFLHIYYCIWIFHGYRYIWFCITLHLCRESFFHKTWSEKPGSFEVQCVRTSIILEDSEKN